MKINYGCGEKYFDGFVNVDIVEGEIDIGESSEFKLTPDLIHDAIKSPLPYPDATVEVIYCLHNIEHIEMRYWGRLFEEFHRLLTPDGQLVLAYPEFEVCSR